MCATDLIRISLPHNLKYAYLDEKKIYPVIISANLSEHEEESVRERSNFKKFPTHTQDHGDA